MVVLGFILVVVAVLVGLGVAISSTSSASIEGFGTELDTTAAVVFFAGVVTAVALLAGLWLMKKGTARTYRRRKEVKELRQQVGTTPATSEPTSEPGSEPGSEPQHMRADEAAAEETPPAPVERPSVNNDESSGRPATTR